MLAPNASRCGFFYINGDEMRLIIYGLMLVFLTACGENKQAQEAISVAPAGDKVSAPVPAGFYPPAVTSPTSIEFKIATINAGHKIKIDDTSIPTAKAYVWDVATKYHAEQDRAAGICVKVFNMIQEKGHQVTLFEIFEAAKAIRKDDVLNLTEKDLAEGLVAYSASRDVQNHTDSVVGLRKIFEFMDKK